MNSKHRRRESLWTKGFVAYTFLQMSLQIRRKAMDIHQRQVWVRKRAERHDRLNSGQERTFNATSQIPPKQTFFESFSLG